MLRLSEAIASIGKGQAWYSIVPKPEPKYTNTPAQYYNNKNTIIHLYRPLTGRCGVNFNEQTLPAVLIWVRIDCAQLIEMDLKY